MNDERIGCHLIKLYATSILYLLIICRLNQKVVCLTSPVLLRTFLTSIFINVDISVREGQLFCDVINDKGPLLKGQVLSF